MTTSETQSKPSLVLPIAIALWAGAVVASMVLLWWFKFTPGEVIEPPASWPRASAIAPAADRPTLVMFVRPSCLCTRASLGELASLLSGYHDRVATFVVFEGGSRPDPEVEAGEYWQRAASLPGVVALHDHGGREADRFHAKTSGFTVVYDPAGRLAFSGGITRARGHSGDNQGRTRVAALLAGRAPDRNDYRVFGCPLESEEKP